MPTSPLPLTNSQRCRRFGNFRFQHSPTPTDPEHVRILGGWPEANIRQVWVPQLRRNVSVNHLVAEPFLALWAEWERLGLLGGAECPGVRHDGRGLVLSFNGAWVPRMKRTKGTYEERRLAAAARGVSGLSNHAWGTAFDLNAAWNGLGREPAALGTTGSVRELVPAAEALGWFWGGHFRSRPDGMHFEWAGLAAPARRLLVNDDAAKTKAARELLSGRPLRRARVAELQAVLGVQPADGVNGPQTKAVARATLAG